MDQRLIRLVGDPNPWTDPVLARDLVWGRVPRKVAEALAFYAKWQMQALVVGTTHRVLRVADGFSEAYEFGPLQYAAWMQKQDAALLFANEWERWQFLDITETQWVTERPPMTNDDWGRLLASFAKLGMGRRLRSEYRMRGSDPPPRFVAIR
jgi:hypothetical protein